MSAPVISGFNNTVLASLYSGSGDWLGINSSIPILVGDTLIVQGVTSPNGFVVVVNTDGTYTVACGGNPARQKFLRYVYHQNPATYDYYIGPSGSDSNPGTQSSPWAITAINTKQSTYAGKNIGILPGTYYPYQVGPAGSFNQPCLNINGGTNTFVGTGSISGNTLTVSGTTSGALAIGSYVYIPGIAPGTFITAGSGSSWTVSVSQSVPNGSLNGYVPTVIQSTTPLGAILDGTCQIWNNTTAYSLGALAQVTGDTLKRIYQCTTANTGNNPTTSGDWTPYSCPMIGQGYLTSDQPNFGNTIIDGLTIRNAAQYNLAFYFENGSTEGGVTGVEIRNTEVYNAYGVYNNNIAGLFLSGLTGAWVHNNKIHDIQPPNDGGNLDDCAGIFDYFCSSNLYEQNTIYNCNNGWFSKFFPNGNHTFRYSYVESLGTYPQNAIHGGSGGQNSGDTNQVYNNVLKCSSNLQDGTLGGGTISQNYWFFNNTCQFGSGQTAINYPAASGNCKHFNNVYIPPVSAEGGEAIFGCYSASLASDCNNFGGTTGAVVGQGLDSHGNLITYTLSAAQAQGYDIHSANVAPVFNSTGTATTGGPNGYKIPAGDVGSASSTTFPGYVGGTTSGAKCDMGAWGGANPPSVLGYTAPQAPATQLDGPSPVWVNEIAPIWAGALFRSNVQPGVVFATVNFASTSYCYSTEGDALTFAIYSGALPPGLALTTTGLLQGTCTTNGIYAFRIIATDITGTSSISATCTVEVGVGGNVTPNLFNLTPAVANAAITSAGLVVGVVTQGYSQTVNAGNIISQLPLANTLVSPGTAVAYVVSLGKSPTTPVPPAPPQQLTVGGQNSALAQAPIQFTQAQPEQQKMNRLAEQVSQIATRVIPPGGKPGQVLTTVAGTNGAPGKLMWVDG